MRWTAFVIAGVLMAGGARAQEPQVDEGAGQGDEQGADDSLVGEPAQQEAPPLSACEAAPTGDQEAAAQQVGLAAEPVTPELSIALGAIVRSGAVVSEVRRGGAAARAGLQRGDVIIALEDQPVACPQALLERLSLLSGLAPSATVEFVRRGVTGTARLALPTPKAVAKPTRAQAP